VLSSALSAAEVRTQEAQRSFVRPFLVFSRQGVAGVFESIGRVFLVRLLQSFSHFEGLAVRDLLVGSAAKHQDRRLDGQSNGRRGPAQNGRPKQPALRVREPF
jgi:hypothetical protein